MIRLEDYESVSFIRWLEKNSGGRDKNIDKLVETFLNTNSSKWNLKFFLKLYQDYLGSQLVRGQVKDYVAILEKFCEGSKCLSNVQLESIDKVPCLQPVLQNFIVFLREEQVYDKLNIEFTNLAKYLYGSEMDIIEWFESIVRTQSKVLIYYFEIYILNSINMAYQYEFGKWIEKNFLKISKKEIPIENFYRTNRKNHLIKAAKNSDRGYCCTVRPKFNLIKEYVSEEESFGFLRYLDSKKIRIEKNVPVYMLNELIDEYCKEDGYGNKIQLKRFIKHVLKDKNVLRDFLEKCTNKPGRVFELDRYYQCKSHGILLFEANGKLSEFLNAYLPDLQDVTGDALDIYFTNEDLKRNVSAYKRIRKLSYLKVEEKEIPCFMIWEQGNSNIQTISLEDLNHKEIYSVIKKLALELKKNSFMQGILTAKSKVQDIKSSKRTVNYILEGCNIDIVGDNGIVVNTKF